MSTGTHTCHWPGCDKPVPPAMWGCRQHWFTLPKRLRDRIWATYRAGQEITKTPSESYIDAAKAVQNWIAEQFLSTPTPALPTTSADSTAGHDEIVATLEKRPAHS